MLAARPLLTRVEKIGDPGGGGRCRGSRRDQSGDGKPWRPALHHPCGRQDREHDSASGADGGGGGRRGPGGIAPQGGRVWVEWKIMPKQRTVISWSSGKDSAWALHVLRQ